MYKTYTFFILFLVIKVFAQQPALDSLRLIFIGDIMNHGPQIKAAYQAENQTYNYDENFKYVKKYFNKADFVIGNLETTLGIKPYSGYPQFSAPPELATGCKQNGINVLVTANNHSCDKRKKGIVRTLAILDSLQILHTGTFKNKQAYEKETPLLLEKNGFKLALLNYTYGTNGLPVPYPTQVNKIDTLAIRKDIEKAHTLQPDDIIVFLHWGKQYQNHPDKQQKKLVAFLHHQGIRMIIGSHPHVIQDIDYEQDYLNDKNSICVYSLGNFISNQRKFPRDGSMFVEILLTKQAGKNISLSGYHAEPLWVYKYTKDSKNHYEILPVKDFQFHPAYFIKNQDYQKMMRYYKHFRGYKFQ